MGQEGGGISDPAHVGRAGGGNVLATLAVVATLAAIVATLLYFPLVLALGFLLRAAGIASGPFATFGGAFGVLPGLVVWWLIVFAGAFVYAACLFPWGDKALASPKTK